ncbi:TIGR01459 family HAD-type hydrolase [Lutibacter sp. B1]|uniref:TIGR01459 family HAD-type hydrolase n=1 Tax=Lutibacter sp. B1 TaxID=2725996 RepID=UPI001456E085|nr:TIGR01459 family HAD-type hydrolase [Lutibacter sp. B1]NLP57587.1 TIGR01459 family HAD-type hydrolase [Lutibacter sp. B1]
MRQIDSFIEIAKNYKAIFFDSFGVFKNYDGVIPGAEKTLNKLRNEGIDYIILTNDASKSPEMLAKDYLKLGYTNVPADKFVSSGMLAKDFIKNKLTSGKIAYLGTEQSASYITNHKMSAIPVEELNFNNEALNSIKALVFLDDEGFHWKRSINNTVNLLRVRNIPVIVANTDLIYPVNENDIAVASGAIADLVEKIVGKHFIHFGKPDVQIFNYAYEHINPNRLYDKKDILMVGDTLTTDIIGANKFGIDTALVLTGNTIPDQAEFMIKTLGIIPDYICESISS